MSEAGNWPRWPFSGQKLPGQETLRVSTLHSHVKDLKTTPVSSGPEASDPVYGRPVRLHVAFQRRRLLSHMAVCYPLLRRVWFGTNDSSKWLNMGTEEQTIYGPQVVPKENHTHWEGMAGRSLRGRRGGGASSCWTFCTKTKILAQRDEREINSATVSWSYWRVEGSLS